MLVIVVMSFAILGFCPSCAAYLNSGLGFSPRQVWLASITWPLGILLASIADVWLAPRLGRGLFMVGIAVMGASVAALIPAFHASGGAVTPARIAPALFVAGLGQGVLPPAPLGLGPGRGPPAPPRPAARGMVARPQA